MKHSLRFAAVAAVGAVALGSTTAARAADVCIGEAANASLSACGGVGTKEFDVGKHGNAPRVSFRSVAPTGEADRRGDAGKPGLPTIQDAPRDDRASRLQARQRALLVNEIKSIEDLMLRY